MKNVTSHYLRWLLCSLLLLPQSFTYAFQKDDRISGQVLDEQDHAPLPGVNVRIKGSNKGTVTDATGHFAFAANAGAVLV
ncbi:MAG TPA: carboxypeptidase-like regulatory domain-containing protein, partial [Chitinophaga sp.]|uniref:carboxypeptidase-like regulatory domain-containing protein n=1 Tax=Chitinophaga sp. TaxID=1869181 RepID=UPI002F92B000